MMKLAHSASFHSLEWIAPSKSGIKQAKDNGGTISPLSFPGRGGGRMWNFEKAMETAVKKTGVLRNGKPMHINPHLLRKANATWLKQRGTDDSLLQPRLGQAPGSRVTAHNYVHLPPESFRTTVIDLNEEQTRKANEVQASRFQ